MIIYYSILYESVFFKDLSTKLFWNDLQNFCIKQGASLDTSISLIEFQQLLRAPLLNPFCGFSSSDVLE